MLKLHKQALVVYIPQCLLWPYGEMDITRVFGTRFEGSNPSRATIFKNINNNLNCFAKTQKLGVNYDSAAN